MKKCAKTESVETSGLEISALSRLQEIESLVDTLVASWNRSYQVVPNRRWHRAALDKPVVLTPLDEETELPVGDPLIASGKDVSVRGISFLHIDPLPYCKVAVSFPDDQEIPTSVVTWLKWCRFTKEGLYQSGGRFVRMIDLELPEQFEFADLFRGK